MMKRFASFMALLALPLCAMQAQESGTEVQQVPYLQEFATAEDFGTFTVVDANADGVTWQHATALGGISRCMGNSSQAADDWLISPPIHLEGGSNYLFQFKGNSGSGKPALLAVAYGQGDTPVDYTVLMEPVEMPRRQTLFETRLQPAASGDYRFAVHCVSEAGATYVNVDDISVTMSARPLSPAAVGDLTVTADGTGQLRASISFTVPTTTVSGEALTTLTRIEVCRDGTDQPVATLANPTPGATLTVTDEGMANGLTRYTVTAYNDHGAGLPATAEAFVGQDIPQQPQGVALADLLTGDLCLTWQAPSVQGANGYSVNPDLLTYNIYGYDAEETPYLYKEGVHGTSLTIPQANQGQEQQKLHFAVSAVSVQGEGEPAQSPTLVVGQPYELPLTETFDGTTDWLWWVSKEGTNDWQYTNIISFDGDDGAVMWRGAGDGEQAWLHSGKVALGSAGHPVLVFRYYALPGFDLQLAVEGTRAYRDTLSLFTVDYSLLDGEAGWRKAVVSLEALTGSDYATLSFHAQGSTYYPIVVDKLIVCDAQPDNLMATRLTTPRSAFVNETVPVQVTVENYGTADATDFSIVLLEDGAEVSRQDGCQLPSFEGATFAVEYSPAVTSGETVLLSARVEHAGQTAETQSAEVRVVGSDLPAVTGLTASRQGGGVTLRWQQPDTSAKTVTEDFERYDPFTVDRFGRWTCVNQHDDLSTVGIAGLSFPHMQEPFAFIAFNPAAIGADNGLYETLSVHGGQQCLACFDTFTQDYSVPTDCWLVSPELETSGQTVSFWAKSVVDYYGLETFDVLYATPGSADFVKLGSAEAPTSWDDAHFSFDLPEGANRFAIRVTSDNAFALLLDDITYTAAPLHIDSYRIYRDGQFVATAPADATSYTDVTASDNTHAYRVTAVYSIGESPLSAEATSTPTDIRNIYDLQYDGSSVYDLSGRPIVNGKLQRGLYIRGGRKFVVR